MTKLFFAEEHEGFLQIMVLIEMVKHIPNIFPKQWVCNVFTISLQYLKQEVRD